MIEEKDEGKAIQEGDTMRAFLENQIVKDAFDRVNKKFFAQFSSSDDKDEIQMVHARARALVDVARELRTVMENGERAQIQRTAREEREATLAKNTRRSR
jgi:hypothetical protein